MAVRAIERIHALELPLRNLTLLVPSASVAEVISMPALLRIPQAPVWLLGAAGWRTLAVPVVSFEALLGGAPAAPTPNSKVVIFYPLRGHRDWEFYGVLTHHDPRPQTVQDIQAEHAAAAELPDSPYIAAGLKSDQRLLAIPDLETLKAAFYPE